MRKLILLLMIVVFVTTIITVDSARPAKGKACRNAGGRCYRDKKAERFCKEYDDEANDCGESKECCLVTASQRKGTVAKRTSKCAGDCDVGTCTPEPRCPEGMRRGRCGRKCVCCTKVKLSKSNGNDSDEKGDSSEEKKPKKSGKRARNKESRPRKGMQKCVTTDECSMKGGKCKNKCKKNGDSSLCSGDCTCCGICQPKGKCSRFDGVCKSSCDGTERLITGGCKKKKKCSCCAPKCTQNGCQGECVSRKKDCNGNFIKNGCGGFKCHCCTSGDEPTPTTTTTPPTPTTTTIRTPTTTPNSSVIPDRLFCAAECGRANLTVPRIVGGQVASRLEYPWIAYITIKGGGGQDVTCGGAIVNRDHVITAAHCFSDRDLATSIITVFLAEHDIDDLTDTEVISIFVQEVFIHPDYKKDGQDTEENDIALLYLGGTLDFGNGVQPICISTPDDFSVGQEVVIVGWGLTDFANKSSSSNLLREVAVTTIDLQQCITLYQNAAERQFVNENMICTLTAGKDACSGDSGGPVIARVDGVWVLLGIVSFGNGCADITAPGVHTNVANYVDWMIEAIDGTFC